MAKEKESIESLKKQLRELRKKREKATERKMLKRAILKEKVHGLLVVGEKVRAGARRIVSGGKRALESMKESEKRKAKKKPKVPGTTFAQRFNKAVAG